MKENLRKQENEILNNIITISKFNITSNIEITKAREVQKLMIQIGLETPIIDPAGNVVFKIEGEDENKNLIITSKIGISLEEKEIFLTQERIMGSGISESVGINALVLLGSLLKKEKMNHNIYLVVTTDKYNQYTGMDYFFKNFVNKINGVINLSGLNLGDLVNEIDASILLKIKLKRKNEYQKNNILFGISTLVNKLKEENILKDTSLKFYDIRTKSDYIKTIDCGEIKIEIKNTSLKKLSEVENIIKNISKGVSLEENVNIEIEKLTRHEAITNANDKLKKIFFEVAKELNIKTNIKKEENQIRIPLSKEIDAISIGITVGGKEKEEYIEINPIYTGIKQAYSLITKFDKE